MNAAQLTELLSTDSFARRTFCGVYPRDVLSLIAVRTNKPATYVINTGTSRTTGEHWVVVYFNGRGKGEFFDSFGLPPRHVDIERFLTRHTLSYIYNSRILQSVVSNTCGLYCLHYIMKRSRGESMDRIVSIFHPQRPRMNDLKIKRIMARKVTWSSEGV